MPAKGLTIKQEKFAQNLFAGMSQRDAYKNSYDCENMTDKSIDETACKLANDLKIISRIEQLTEELKQRNMVTVERILTEYSKLGFYDPRNLFRDDGQPKEITELDDETAAALSGLDVQEVYEGTGSDRKFVGYTKKYKLSDKKAALDSMAKYLGMFKENVQLSGGLNNTITDLPVSEEEQQELIKKLMNK